jgi:hypothetical protein
MNTFFQIKIVDKSQVYMNFTRLILSDFGLVHLNDIFLNEKPSLSMPSSSRLWVTALYF